MTRTKVLTSLRDLYQFFGAVETPAGLNHRIYKDTACGASISLHLAHPNQPCEKCQSYFSRFSCGARVGQGECDCPKCQGFCRCQYWIHNGSGSETQRVLDPAFNTQCDGFTIQTIVEGSEATVDSGLFLFPVRETVIQTWLRQMERQAQELWEAANSLDEQEQD